MLIPCPAEDDTALNRQSAAWPAVSSSMQAFTTGRDGRSPEPIFLQLSTIQISQKQLPGQPRNHRASQMRRERSSVVVCEKSQGPAILWLSKQNVRKLSQLFPHLIAYSIAVSKCFPLRFQ